MEYSLKIDHENRIVKVKATGLLNQVGRKGMLDSIAIELSSNNFSKALIDLTSTTIRASEPVSGAFELIEYMKAIGIKSETKLAFISVSAEYHRKYFEEYARLGGFDIRYFKNSDDALAWLG